MIFIEKVDTRSKRQVRRFIRLPYRIYRNDRCWVPALLMDQENQLSRQKNPFFEHSEADFFLAVRDGRDAGRIAILENRRFNEFHGTRKAQFYLFESENDPEISQALFERARDWARERGLDTIIGPKGFGPLDGYGLLIDGFDKPQMMSMMTHNPAYYVPLIESEGFTKEVDFVSCYAEAATFRLPDRVRAIAERVEKRGELRVQSFTTIKELKKWGGRVGQAYNKAFVHNWEYYPLTEREVSSIVSSLEMVADPKLIKLITHGEDIVGFLLAFPELGAALQRSGGRLFPFGLIDLLLEQRRTKLLSVNGAGVLPEFQGRGGNALLYAEMERTIRSTRFTHAVLYQVAETAVDMRRDLETIGGRPYKNHRVYTSKI
ncbi:MAG: hypothetical protein ACM3JD_13845 [Rudaea sp.]